MADRVDMPAALRAEIAADLASGGDRAKRWRQPSPHQVVVLARGEDAWPIGWVGTLTDVTDHSGAVTAPSQPHPAAATAWAPVGGVDGGPRPDIGDRTLVLTDAGGDCPEPWIGHVTYASWGNLPIGSVMVGGRTHLAAEESAVTRWAILPPEVPAEVHALCVDLDQALDVGTGLAQIIGPDQPVDPLTANPDHTWPCADYCCTRGCPGIGNTLHGPPWPCDATRCTCGNTVIRAVAHDRQRLARILTDLTAWLTTERDRLHTEHRRDATREPGPMIEARTLRIVLDRLRDQGLDVETPHVREGLATP